LKDIAGTLKTMNDKKKFLDPQEEILTNGMATVTTSSDIKQRFDKNARTYDTGGDTSISLKPSNWLSNIPPHSDRDFRKNNKEAFVRAGITKVDEIDDKTIEKIREELSRSTNNSDFRDWNAVELKNLFNDSQK
jgi:hypothetical protein